MKKSLRSKVLRGFHVKVKEVRPKNNIAAIILTV